jgi:hypothetical protein
MAFSYGQISLRCYARAARSMEEDARSDSKKNYQVIGLLGICTMALLLYILG